ncbi:MAG: LacI family transcriptional regulator [Selenomonas sp.]|nr:LacI family transcriptional regulator [Selenomonas sp.]
MTIYDIAKACGVSIATVSRVLNNSEKVSEKTRQKVLAVIQEENYSPNPFARGLGLDSMKMIGLLCTDVSDAFYAKAVSLVEHELKQRGLDMMLVCTGNDLNEKKKYIQFLLKKHVDAIILIGSPFREDGDNSHVAEAAHEVPIIAINSLLELPNVYSVLCDEASGIELAVRRLADNGCRNILYLYDNLTYSGQQKIRGYREGLEAAGLQKQDKFLCQVSKDLISAQQMVQRLLKQQLPFSAIIGSEDIIAIGAQKALSAAGIEIPVIGCNNSVLAECATPSLTSIDNRLDILCPAAVDVLTKILDNGPQAAPSQTVFPAIIQYRESFKE